MWKDNRIVLNLSKVTFGRFYYRNQWGQLTDVLPPKEIITVHGVKFAANESMYGSTERAIDAAKRLGMLDVWIPEVKFQLTANHQIVYTGDKAKSLWKEYCRRIFNKKK